MQSPQTRAPRSRGTPRCRCGLYNWAAGGSSSMGLGLGRHANRTLACLLLIMAALHPLRAQDPEAAANQKKARATLDAMVAALGGQRWLTLTSSMEQGRTSGFYQGKPTGMTAEFYEIQKFPDQSRIELGKKRDVVEIILPDQAWEVTYKG